MDQNNHIHRQQLRTFDDRHIIALDSPLNDTILR